MTKTGRCYLYKKTNSPVNGREFVLGISPELQKSSRRPQREFARVRGASPRGLGPQGFASPRTRAGPNASSRGSSHLPTNELAPESPPL